MQGAVRDFLACKKGRMKALDKIWEAYEFQYIAVRYAFYMLHCAVLFFSFPSLHIPPCCHCCCFEAISVYFYCFLLFLLVV